MISYKPVTIKGMLRQNIESFLEKRIYEKLDITKMKKLKKFLFLFPTVCILWKYRTPFTF